MSLHYILDGYNIIHEMPSLLKVSLEKARQGLVNYLQTYQPQGSLRNEITIVFDGSPDVITPFPTKEHHIHIIFTTKSSADEKIIKIVENSKNPRNIIVITNDREIKETVRALNAQTLSPKAFLQPKKKIIKLKYAKPFPETEQGKEITQELMNLWGK